MNLKMSLGSFTRAHAWTLFCLTCLHLLSCAPPAPPGPYPSVGAITNELPTVHRVCLGTLIAPDRVLTAAHCVVAQKAARYRFVSWSKDGERVHRLKEVRIHPDFDRKDQEDTAANDIAVLTLVEPANDIPVESLSSPGALEHTPTVTVVGYGTARSDGPAPPLLSAADGDVLWLRSTEVAAGRSGQRQICHGDSGGPAFIRDETGRRLLVGVVSRGIRAECTAGAIFTRVDAFLDWIGPGAGRARTTWGLARLGAKARVVCAGLALALFGALGALRSRRARRSVCRRCTGGTRRVCRRT
jgi:secreted trypsin-like serine protease